MELITMLTIKEYSRISGLSEKSIREFARIESFPAVNSNIKVLINQEPTNKRVGEYASKTPHSLAITS